MATGCTVTVLGAALDEKNGFRDATFGAPLSTFEGLQEVRRDGGVVYYRREGDELRIGEAQLDLIRYGFYQGRLYEVAILTTGSSNSKALLRALEATYGWGDQPNPYIETYLWRGRSVEMFFVEESLGESAVVSMKSKLIDRERKRDQKTAAAKAASDL